MIHPPLFYIPSSSKSPSFFLIFHCSLTWHHFEKVEFRPAKAGGRIKVKNGNWQQRNPLIYTIESYLALTRQASREGWVTCIIIVRCPFIGHWLHECSWNGLQLPKTHCPREHVVIAPRTSYIHT